MNYGIASLVVALNGGTRLIPIKQAIDLRNSYDWTNDGGRCTSRRLYGLVLEPVDILSD